MPRRTNESPTSSAERSGAARDYWSHVARHAGAAGVLTIAFSNAACVTRTVAHVRVRDPNDVYLVDDDDSVHRIPSGDEGIVTAHGLYDHYTYPYELRVRRDPGGAITLSCPLCEPPEYFREHVPVKVLVGADGLSHELAPSNVVMGDTQVLMTFDICFVGTYNPRSGCTLPSETRLVVEQKDVIEVRRRVVPERSFGAFLLLTGASILAVTATVYFATDSREARTGAAVASTFAIPYLGFGLWSTFAPIEETVTWRPGQ